MDTEACISASALAEFRERLISGRNRLIERIIAEYDPAHQYPSSTWTRMVGDINALIQVVNSMISEAKA